MVEMADADDSESWFESALRYAELAAHQIARFRNPWWNPTWQDLVADDPPPDRSFTIGWGLRGKRSRTVDAGTRFVKGHAAACSPATPFHFGSGSGSGSGSGASTSGGEEGSSSPEKAAAKRLRVGGGADASGAGGGGETKVVAIQRGPMVFVISAAKDIRRTGKKKTLCELQEEEKLLWEERNQLQKEMELRRKAYEALQAENRRLRNQQISFQSQEVSFKFATARASSAAPSSSTHFILPDLNEPLSENLD